MREKISCAARDWIGTPFHRQGRLKNVGCDCLGLFMGVAKELKIKTKFGLPVIDLDQDNYDLIFDGSRLEKELDNNFQLKQFYEEGDLVLLEYDSNPQHLGIITKYRDQYFIIHSNIKRREVIEHILDEDMVKKIKKIYSIINI